MQNTNSFLVKNVAKNTPAEIDAVRSYVNGLKKVVGFTIVTQAGQAVSVDLKFPIPPKKIIGLAWANTNMPIGKFSLQVNNEFVVQDVLCEFLNVVTSLHTGDFFPYERPVQGSETIKLTVTDAGTRSAAFSVWYI